MGRRRVLVSTEGGASGVMVAALIGLCVLSVGCRQAASVTIMEIQGRGALSPLEGRSVNTSGVVTFVLADGSGFFLQDPAGDEDPATSDAIFASMEGASPGIVLASVGNVVRVEGRAQEARAGRALPRSQLTGLSRLDVVSRGQPLPAPIALEDLPDESIAEGKAFWEALEGMRVEVHDAPVVAPTSRFGELVVLSAGDARPGSGFHRETGHLLVRPLSQDRVDYNPERIIVAAGATAEALDARPGDRVKRLVGVVDYTFANYKIRASRLRLELQERPRTPVSQRSGPEGDWVVTTLNLENLFDLEDDPQTRDEQSTPSAEELEVKLRKLARASCDELLGPEILVVQEVENESILAKLAERANARCGTAYVATSRGSSDPRGIEVGFLWDRRRVRLQDAQLMEGEDVDRVFGRGSKSPGREPLVGVFDVRGHTVTIIGNHFKSKRGDEPLYGVDEPALRPTEVLRRAQARVVRRYVDRLLEEDPEAWVVVAGDLNDFPFGEPGEGPEHPLALLEGRHPRRRLTDLISREDPSERFTFIYQGNAQVLDHILVSPALLSQVVGVDVLHFNASYPAAWAPDGSTQLRCSDHDAVEARFRLH